MADGYGFAGEGEHVEILVPGEEVGAAGGGLHEEAQVGEGGSIIT